MYTDLLNDYQNIKHMVEYLNIQLDDATKRLDNIQSDIFLEDDPEAKEKETIQKRIKRLESELEQRKVYVDKLENLISKMNDLEGKIIKEKYVNGLSLPEVAEKLGYSISHIKKTHGAIIRRIRLIEAFAKL